MPTDIKLKIRADNNTSRAFKQVKSDINGLGNSVGRLSGKLTAVLSAAGIGALVKMNVDAAKETLAYSRAIGVQVESLSAWQYAARDVNIQGDKMADIFKDVSEKIGDAFANNAGEASEVLRRLNLDIDAMARLSPDQQLLAVADALQNVQTHGEKVQALEALASDASLLLPLLEDNAAGLRRLSDEGRAAGAVLTDLESQRLKQVDDIMRKVSASTQGFGKEFALAFGEPFADLVNYLTGTAIPAFRLLAERIGLIDTNINSLSDTEAVVRIEVLTERMAGLKREMEIKIRDHVSTDGVLMEISQVTAELEKLKRRRDEIAAPLPDVTVPGVAGTNAAVDNTAELEATANAFRLLDEQRVMDEKQRMREEDAHLRRFANAQMLLDQQAVLDAEVAAAKAAQEEKMGSIHQTLGNLTTLTASKSKSLFKIGKAASIASAIINTHEAITKTMASVPYPFNIPLAIAQGAAGMVQVQNIKSQQFTGAREHGGPVVAGQPYLVGERRAEIFVPNQSGKILPDASAGLGGNQINVTVMDGREDAGVFANKVWNIIMDRMNEEGLSFA